LAEFATEALIGGMWLDDRFRETGRHGTSDVFVDSPFGFD
jgi:hypothetical protein